MIASLSPMARAWLTVGLLWFVACLNYLDRVMITTMRASLVDAIPMTDAQFGLLTSVFLWVYALLSPLGGYLADRFSRSRVVLGSLFVWSAITWLTGHAQTFNQLLLARALMGVSEACYLPAALALIMDYHRGSTRSLATGVHMTGVMVGAGLGGLGGWLAGRHDWSYAFTLFGMIGVAYAVVLILLLREAPRENVADNHGGGMTDPVRFQDAWVSLFSRSAFILALAFWGLNGLVGWALVGWLPTYLGERFQLSQGAAGLSATGYLQGASLLGVLIGGAWADRWSRRNERGRLFVPAIGFCLAAPAIFLASVTSLLPLAIGGLVLYGVGRAFADSNMMPILCLVADPRYRATGYGILNLCSCVIGGLTIYAGGALRDAEFNVRLLFQAAAASLVICAGFLALIKPVPSSRSR
jgi:MFS family permease